jgi:hypothetical protein
MLDRLGSSQNYELYQYNLRYNSLYERFRVYLPLTNNWEEEERRLQEEPIEEDKYSEVEAPMEGKVWPEEGESSEEEATGEEDRETEHS